LNHPASLPTSRQWLTDRLANLNGHEGPLYLRLAAVLRHAIQDGVYAHGACLPPERELSETLGVSRVTLRRAIESLAREGVVSVRQGSGTFVGACIEEPLSALASFSEDMLRRGLTPGSSWISRKIVAPDSGESLALGLGAQDRVLRASRVRTANGEPIAVERATVRASDVGSVADFGDSLYAALMRHGAHPARAVQRIRAGIADPESAKLLQVSVGDAVLVTERRSFTREGRPVEITHSLYRADIYDYVVEMSIPLDSRPAA
jgi:GntR family transcriptional regulator